MSKNNNIFSRIENQVLAMGLFIITIIYCLMRYNVIKFDNPEAGFIYALATVITTIFSISIALTIFGITNFLRGLSSEQLKIVLYGKYMIGYVSINIISISVLFLLAGIQIDPNICFDTNILICNNLNNSFLGQNCSSLILHARLQNQSPTLLLPVLNIGYNSFAFLIFISCLIYFLSYYFFIINQMNIKNISNLIINTMPITFEKQKYIKNINKYLEYTGYLLNQNDLDAVKENISIIRVKHNEYIDEYLE